MYIVHVQLPHLKVKILDNNKTILRKENPTSRLEKQKEVLTSTNGSLTMEKKNRWWLFTNKCFHWSNINSSRVLLNSQMICELRSSDYGVPKMKLPVALGLTRGGENKFLLDKMYMAKIFCKKMDQIAHFCPEWWFKHFTPAYRGSPPPAVFQNKYQKRNMKEIQQGNLLHSPIIPGPR